MVGETIIADYNLYNKNMAESITDKLFFLEKISAQTILDFGCADGQMLGKMKKLGCNMNLFGFDLDSKMIQLAKENIKSATFSTDWDSLITSIPKEETVFNASSVIHEVYSYSSNEEIEQFWDRCFNSGFEYISIRDMMISKSACRISNPLNVLKTILFSNRKLLKDFEKKNGSIIKNKNLLHYLLKYRYEDNWEREVKENYLPITLEELLAKIPDTYEMIFFETYTLPFVKTKIKEDFGITLKDNTHVKILLKLKKNS